VSGALRYSLLFPGFLMPIRALIIVLLAVVALTGCGRRGNLEAPKATVTDQSVETTLPADGISPLDPGSNPAKEETPAPAPKKGRFFLDFLL